LELGVPNHGYKQKTFSLDLQSSMPNFELGISNFKPQLTNQKFGGQTLLVTPNFGGGEQFFWFQTMADIKKNVVNLYVNPFIVLLQNLSFNVLLPK
jgi:hypothetical protein